MPRDRETGGAGGALTPAEVQATIQAEVKRATTPAPAITTAPTSISSGTYLNPTAATVATVAPPAPTVDPLKNKAVQPTAPAGYHYTWIGGTTTGSWQLYKDTAAPATGGGATTTGSTTATTPIATTPVDATAALTAAYNQQLAASNAAQIQAGRQSAYNILLEQFKQYGLESLVKDAKDIIINSSSPAEMSLALQNTDAYKKRFVANQDRIAKGLRALDPATYIKLEDQYQNIMRNYGLPATYYAKDSLGTQAGFNKLIANDVDPTELEDRILTAQQRVMNSDVNTKNALRQFYPNITDGDLLAYTLDPTNALNDIKRKVTAAEIGGAALGQGLMTSAPSAEALAGYGITKAQAQQGYQTIGEFLPGATKLADIYQQQGIGPYSQATAEQEVFGTANAAEAARKRKRLTQLEQAQFGGQSGTSQNALNRDRQMSNYMLGSPGAGQF